MHVSHAVFIKLNGMIPIYNN